jgi:hypothetical protein
LVLRDISSVTYVLIVLVLVLVVVLDYSSGISRTRTNPGTLTPWAATVDAVIGEHYG